MSAPANGGMRSSRRSAVRRRALVALLLVGAGFVAGCGTSGPVTVPASIGPIGTVGQPTGDTFEVLRRELGARSIILEDREAPFRPAEGPLLTVAPRMDYQAQLPADPEAGTIVVYELPSAEAAMEAAEDQAAYLGSGPGRVQYPDAARHVIRVLGQTVILYSWIPESAEDPLTPEIAAALATIGTGVDIPR
jgi:hypothetical protein